MSNMEWYTSLYHLTVVLVDLVIAFVFLALSGRLVGVENGMNTAHELTQKDNPAFGISFAGSVLALGIVMMGAASGDGLPNLGAESVSMGIYGGLGIVLMFVTRKFLDKVEMRTFSIPDAIKSGTVSAGIVDAANMIATAIIIKAVMSWVDTNSYEGLWVVLAAFVASQVLMTLVGKYRGKIFMVRNGEKLENALRDGNVALSLRYAGNKIGVAIGVSAVSGFVVYREDQLVSSVLVWGISALVAAIVVSLVAVAGRLIILRKVNVAEEVDSQKNAGVGLIEGVTYLVSGSLLFASFV